MLEWTQKFKEAKHTIDTQDGTTGRVFYANASKPFDMRQRDAKLFSTLDGFKLIAGEENHNKFRLDMSNGRIVYDCQLIAQRGADSDIPAPIMANVQKFWPTLSEEAIANKVAEATEKRAAAQRDR